MGFQEQCKYVQNHLWNVIDGLIAQNDNIVIEGVHLTVEFMMKAMEKYPFCIPFVVCIKNKEKHKERFAVRSKQMTLDPKYNKYVESYESIRAIHKSFVRKGEKFLVPRIDNSNVDKSLGLIHSTIVRCLRKISNNESLVDPEINKASILCHEFNTVSRTGLSSTDAQKIIKAKVNKNEIFKRFFGNDVEEPAPEEEEENVIKRVYSFDMNEVTKFGEEEGIVFTHDRDQSNKEDSIIIKPFEATTSDYPVEEKVRTPLAQSNILEESEENKEEKPNDNEENNEEELVPIKASKSSENLLEEQAKKKKKKKIKFGGFTTKYYRAKRPVDENSDEDKNSIASGSGMCSVFSGSVDVITHLKTEDVGSRSAGESDASDEEDKDIDSVGADKASRFNEIAEESSEESSDPDDEKNVRNQLKTYDSNKQITKPSESPRSESQQEKNGIIPPSHFPEVPSAPQLSQHTPYYF